MVLAALQGAPSDPQLHRLLPENFVCISVQMEDDLCYVNMTEETAERMARLENRELVYLSVELSLLSLSKVNAVEFLKNGGLIDGRTLLPERA